VGLPQVAIVGRPNVGKSSLFNWLAGRRIAIVDPTPGVTRDRLTTPVQAGNRYFELTDTGGIGVVDVDALTRDVERQIAYAIDRAQVILFVVDARTGLVPLDERVAVRLRGVGKPVLLVANKCDHAGLDQHIAEFYKLGFGTVYPVSAQQFRGKPELFDRILEHLPAEGAEETPDVGDVLKIAMVGRRNTGKSTFINALAQEERAIVSEVEGTTRDSVDVTFERDGKKIIAIDTAGVRYRGKVKSDIDFYSLSRSERSIRRADVVLHLLDATKKASLVDKQLAGYILENHKPAVFVVNKWDLAKGQAFTGEYGEYLRRVFPSLDFVPIAFLTAKDGKNVQKVINLAQNLHKQAGVRVPTGDLNRVIQRAMLEQSPPLRKNRLPKVYFVTQVAVQPPTIVLFTNGPDLFDKTYRRYLLKTLRDHFGFHDVPIKMYLRPKQRDENRSLEDRLAKQAAKTIKTSRPRKEKDKGTGELWDDL
jgi:GTP-binding protein